jgi:hypothetical protein
MEQDPWNNSSTKEHETVSNLDGACDISGSAHNASSDPPSSSIPASKRKTSWEAEKARRLATRVEQAQREVEEEFEAWESALSPRQAPKGHVSTGQVPDSEGGDPVPFSKTLQQTHDAQGKKTAKKSAEEKRRELEMRVRNEDGISGPVDWAVGGRDGCSK